MRQGSSQQGADPSLRLSDLTLQQSHYQTGVATRQPLAALGLIATINRENASSIQGNKSHATCACELFSHGVKVPISGPPCYVIVLTWGYPAGHWSPMAGGFDLWHRQWLAARIGRSTKTTKNGEAILWETSTKSTRCAM